MAGSRLAQQPRLGGSALDARTLARMRVLLIDHEVEPTIVAQRLGCSRRTVYYYWRLWKFGVADPGNHQVVEASPKPPTDG